MPDAGAQAHRPRGSMGATTDITTEVAGAPNERAPRRGSAVARAGWCSGGRLPVVGTRHHHRIAGRVARVRMNRGNSGNGGNGTARKRSRRRNAAGGEAIARRLMTRVPGGGGWRVGMRRGHAVPGVCMGDGRGGAVLGLRSRCCVDGVMRRMRIGRKTDGSRTRAMVQTWRSRDLQQPRHRPDQGEQPPCELPRHAPSHP
jgi:hypothetical protein